MKSFYHITVNMNEIFLEIEERPTAILCQDRLQGLQYCGQQTLALVHCLTHNVHLHKITQSPRGLRLGGGIDPQI